MEQYTGQCNNTTWSETTRTLEVVTALNQPKWLTKPWTAPGSFNWEPLMNIKSPKCIPGIKSLVLQKFYTEQGSEYIRAEDGSTRRIKSYHPNTDWDDIWLKAWFGKAIFTKGEEWSNFNLAVQILIDKGYNIQICQSNKNKHIAIICIHDWEKWRQAKISDAYSKAVKEKTLKDWPLKTEYSTTPELRSYILEFNMIDKSKTITKAHP